MRFLSVLPSGGALDLVILKAHLLLEEQINVLIDERLNNADALRSADLDSFQRICLAESFFSPDFQPWLWRGLKQLNKLRNEIAHQIAPEGLQARVDNIIKFVPGAPEFKPFAATPQAHFEMTLWSLFDAVSRLVKSRKASVVGLFSSE
jgi:hypothetical protein